MIEKLVENSVDSFDIRDLADLFINGMKGYDEMSDEEIKDEYDIFFEEN